MELTKAQERGLRIAVERYKQKEPYTVISGYAGVGKSTLIRFIIEALNLDPENEVAYVSFTGKASEVLRSMGCPNATTAHKLLYYSRQLPNGKFVYKPRTSFEKPYKVIVVDEISLLPLDIWNLLLSHHVYVLASGDPFQLPPVSKDQDNHVLDHPHIFLDEIMRQAKESDIICLSMDIREGKKISPFNGNDTRVFKKADLIDGMFTWADQIICGTNKSRNEINAYMRQSLGRGQEPCLEDKIICGRNCWDELSIKYHNPLINGTIGYIKDMSYIEAKYACRGKYFDVPVLSTDIYTSDDGYLGVAIDYTSLLTGNKFFTPEQEYYVKRSKFNECNPPIEFSYGYAITCHRAQGSQWDKVLVIEERFPFDTIEHARWLYTACTRAASKLTLVLKG